MISRTSQRNALDVRDGTARFRRVPPCNRAVRGSSPLAGSPSDLRKRAAGVARLPQHCLRFVTVVTVVTVVAGMSHHEWLQEPIGCVSVCFAGEVDPTVLVVSAFVNVCSVAAPVSGGGELNRPPFVSRFTGLSASRADAGTTTRALVMLTRLPPSRCQSWPRRNRHAIPSGTRLVSTPAAATPTRGPKGNGSITRKIEMMRAYLDVAERMGRSRGRELEWRE